MDARTQHQQTQNAALTKLDRCLQELERIGGQRIRPMAEVVEQLDLDQLKSVVFDIEDALTRYADAKKELRRIHAA